MAQEMDEDRKTSLEKMVATELLKLAMETNEERKARLKKIFVKSLTHSLSVSGFLCAKSGVSMSVRQGQWPMEYQVFLNILCLLHCVPL